MRLLRYFTCLFLFTCLSLLYTHQQFLFIKTNYNVIKCRNREAQLLDRNKKLMYNVTTLESPAALESKLSANGSDYDMPSEWAVKRRGKSTPAYGLEAVAERRNVVLERILNFVALRLKPELLKIKTASM